MKQQYDSDYNSDDPFYEFDDYYDNYSSCSLNEQDADYEYFPFTQRVEFEVKVYHYFGSQEEDQEQKIEEEEEEEDYNFTIKHHNKIFISDWENFKNMHYPLVSCIDKIVLKYFDTSKFKNVKFMLQHSIEMAVKKKYKSIGEDDKKEKLKKIKKQIQKRIIESEYDSVVLNDSHHDDNDDDNDNYSYHNDFDYGQHSSYYQHSDDEWMKIQMSIKVFNKNRMYVECTNIL